MATEAARRPPSQRDPKQAASVYEFEARRIDGSLESFEVYRGRVLLIVNVASRCTLTPQYRSLEGLYQRYRDRGLTVLGFPCDQFGHQEPGSDAEIAEFCSLKYDVSFPMFSKVEVNGPGAHPLFNFLKDRARGWLRARRIQWNFTKFLIDRRGIPIRRYGPGHPPSLLAAAIERQLKSDEKRAASGGKNP